MKISSFPENWLEIKQKPSLFDTFARNSLFRFLNTLDQGHLRLQDGSQGFDFGDRYSDLKATVIVLNPAFYRMAVFGGSIGAGEAYISGCWQSPDLTAVTRVISRNINQLNQFDKGFSFLSMLFHKLQHKCIPNSLQGSKRNIQAHYDLSNDLFSTFLDPEMMYSSAIYTDNTINLDQAAIHKLKVIGEKLELNVRHHVVEVGCGWGGLAIYLAKIYGCRVTTTTISEEQYKCACERVKSSQLDHLVTVLKKDYRLLDGKYDRLVSVEMIEAVGHKYFSTFFRKCNQLLKPGGLMVLQAITIPEQRYDFAKHNVDFIQRYIFPGGCLPSVETMLSSTGRYTDLQLHQIDDIGLDYAQTLYHWRERFTSSLSQVRQLGFDELFIRLWEFYLSYCEGGFRERAISTIQATFRKT